MHPIGPNLPLPPQAPASASPASSTLLSDPVVVVVAGLAYIITHCDKEYSYAIVGLADRSNLWVLSRSPELPAAKYADALTRAESQGFDMSKVLRVANPAGQALAGRLAGTSAVDAAAAEASAFRDIEPEPAPERSA